MYPPTTVFTFTFCSVSAGLVLYYLEMDALLHHIIPDHISEK